MILGGGFVDSSFKLADAFFHLFAGLKCYNELLWHKDFFACTRIAGLTCSPLFDLENAEITQLDPLILDQCVDDCVERFLDDFLGLELSKPNLLGDGLYDFFFRHDEVPYQKDRRALLRAAIDEK